MAEPHIAQCGFSEGGRMTPFQLMPPEARLIGLSGDMLCLMMQRWTVESNMFALAQDLHLGRTED